MLSHITEPTHHHKTLRSPIHKADGKQRMSDYMPHARRSNAWSDDFTNTSSDESYKREQSKQATGLKAKDVNRGWGILTHRAWLSVFNYKAPPLMLVKNHGGIEAAQQLPANDTPSGLHSRLSLHWSTDFSKLQCSYNFTRLVCSHHHYLHSFRLLKQSHHNWFSSHVQMHFWMDNYTDEPVSNETPVPMPPPKIPVATTKALGR